MNNHSDGPEFPDFGAFARGMDDGGVRQQKKSMRDKFALRAMTMFQGVDITCETDIRRRFDFSDAASLAYQYADAMLAERAK